jgi:hypothetical protein
VVLLGERGAEQRHQPIASELVHHPLEAVDPLAQDRQAAIHHPPPVLRVEPLGQLHRPDHVREQHRHQLALPLQRAARRQHPLGQPVRRIGAPIARCRTTGAAGRCGYALHRRPPRARRSGRPHPANSAARSARPSVVREAPLDTAGAPGAVASAYRIPGKTSLHLCPIAPARTRAMVRGGANHNHPPGLSAGCPANAPAPSDKAKAPEIPVIKPPRGRGRGCSGPPRDGSEPAQRVPAQADGAASSRRKRSARPRQWATSNGRSLGPATSSTTIRSAPSERWSSTIGAPTLLLHRRSTAREFVLSTLLLSREGRSGSSRHR